MAKRYHSGSYEGRDARRAQEHADSSMIHGTGFANLPQEVIMREYPKPYGYMGENINDKISGIDRQIKDDSGHHKTDGSKY